MRSHLEVEMPITATIMPSTSPIAVAATEMISVFFSPTLSSCGKTAHMAPKSKNVRLIVSSQSIGVSSGGGRSVSATCGHRPTGGWMSALLGLGQVLLRHRGTWEPLLVELLPGAVLHGRVETLVQRVHERDVALLDGEAGRCVEGGDVHGHLEVVVARDVLLGRLVVGEVRVDRSAVH